jgi:hypothetical protein
VTNEKLKTNFGRVYYARKVSGLAKFRVQGVYSRRYGEMFTASALTSIVFLSRPRTVFRAMKWGTVF